MSQRGEQTWFLFSSLRHDCCSLLSDMILNLLSLASLLFSSLIHDCCSLSLRHDCCPPLSDIIVVLLSQIWLEKRTTIMSERGEQQSCLREENNNHVWERRTPIMSEWADHVWEMRTIIISERGEQQSFLRDIIVVLLSQTWLLLSFRHDCCSLSQT
jgi:hypothetical protein